MRAYVLHAAAGCIAGATLALLLTFIFFPLLPVAHDLATFQGRLFFQRISTSVPIGAMIGMLLGLCSKRLSRYNQHVALRMWGYYLAWALVGMLLGRLAVTLMLPSTNPEVLMHIAAIDSPIVVALGASIAVLLALLVDFGRRVARSRHSSPPDAGQPPD